MKNTAEIFGKFTTETAFEDCPAQAVKAAKNIITDSIGVIIGGMAEPDIQAMIHHLLEDKTSDGVIPLLGTTFKTDKSKASFIHGTAGTVLEMDEGHQFAKGHPGMHILPALMAEAATKEIKAQDFLRAFMLGYDVAARIGLATSLNPKMHPHGTWGGLGAAAALGVIEGLKTEEMTELLNIASSLTLASSRKTMLEGGTVRNTYTGFSNQMAHVSLSLLKSGFSGEKDGINSVFGHVVSNYFDHKLAFEALGDRFEVCRNYFKLHACCRYNHAALDALNLLMAKHPELLDLSAIKSINVESYNLAAELHDPKPRNVLACKFSIPFAIATTLYHQSTDVLSFTEDALEVPEIQDLCQKVSIIENPKMTEKLPDLRPASVKIRMQNGALIETEVMTNRGDWQDPYEESDLKQKFMSLTTRCWSTQKAEEIYDVLMSFEDYEPQGILNKLAQ